MSPYVLILLFSGLSSDGAAVGSVPFETLAACEVARARVLQEYEYTRATSDFAGGRFTPVATCSATGAKP